MESSSFICDRNPENSCIDFNQLRTLLPHRPPFLLIDRITELTPGVCGVGVKNVTFNDFQLVGHFPGRPIFPGVLMVEACAQLGAIVIGSVEPIESNIGARTPVSLGYLASINHFKFTAITVPGDRLRIKVEIGKRLGNLFQLRAEIRCGRTKSAAGEIVLSLPPEPPA